MKKFVIISDTHQLETDLTVPQGDFLIHCGDFTNRGKNHEIEKFMKWFSAQPHTHKIFIAGNHELGLDTGSSRIEKLEIIRGFTNKNNNLHYLENSEAVIEGFKFYGSPVTPWFHSWAFNKTRGSEIAGYWEQIPDDTDILITHGPPYGILDLVELYGEKRDIHQGCEELTKRVFELKQLKLHCVGHLHLGGGQIKIINNIQFVNAAICDDNLHPTRKPVVVDL